MISYVHIYNIVGIFSVINIDFLYYSSSPDSLSGERSDSKSPGGTASPCILYKLVVPLLKCELSDVRDVAVHAIGHINSDALKYVV